MADRQRKADRTVRVGDSQVEEDRTPTRRVVLQRHRALLIPEGATEDQVAEAIKPLLKRRGAQVFTDAWVERGVFEGSKVGAIEAFAGKPGTPDAKLGEFKAPTVTAMKGGVRLSAPPIPLVEREMID